MNNIMEIKKLKKSYLEFTLSIPSLNFKTGCIIGLIGENGAGKTTLIKSILNIINKDEGTIKILNKSLLHDEYKIKEEIGVVLDNTFFPELLTPQDINIIMKDLYRNWDQNLYYGYLEKFKISKNSQIKNLSTGTRKKLEIITALAHKPKLLILDEPTSGLDPVVRGDVLNLFQDFIQDEENTIIFSTHITSDLEHIADQIIFLNEGKLLLNEEKDVLIDNYGILKCKTSDFDKIDKKDIVRYQKTKYSYEILVKDKGKMRKKYHDFVMDSITLDDLMIMYIKGELL